MIGRHFSAEAIARYSEDDLSERKAARVSSHLARCRQCAELRSDLARVPALLARTEVPPLPDHLAHRIQAALASESAARSRMTEAGAAERQAAGLSTGQPRASSPHASSPHASSPRASSHRARPAARDGRRGPWMSPRGAGWAAAAAAVIVAVGGGTYALVGHSGNGTATAGGQASGSHPALRPGQHSGQADVPAVPGIRVAGPQLRYQRDGQPVTFTPVVSGTHFAVASLAAQVGAVLAQYRQATAPTGAGTRPLTTPLPSTATPGSEVPLGGFSRAALAACVTRISAGQLVQLVDIATYQSSPAAVIVAGPRANGIEQVWVVGTGCSASSSDVLRHATITAGG